VRFGSRDEEATGRGAGAEPEHRPERVTLRVWEPIEAIEERRAELVQPAVDELDLSETPCRRRRKAAVSDP
jgi:hypothetical protein